ncbi:MAG: OsmC family protein [Pseudorhodobacter sp.]
MALRLRPKRFGPVFVRFDGGEGISFATDGDEPGQSFPPHDKPVLTLMAALGHCLVESIRMVARQDDTVLEPFAISVTAEKSIEGPGRLQKVECRIHGAVTKDAESADILVKTAKEICTVSNSMNSDISVV